jgi:rod shape determining protein RodA
MSGLTLLLPTVSALLLTAGFWTLTSVAPADLGRQGVALALGLVLCALLGGLGMARLWAWRWELYLGALLLLVLVLLFGTEVNGARSWLQLGPLPGFQPSELVKLALILALAGTLAKRQLRGPLDYPVPLLLIGVPVGLVLLEPDLGSALVIATVGAGMMLVRGVPPRHLLLLLFSAALLLPGAVWPNLAPHQRARLVSFIAPDAEPLGSGYQVIQARIAVGAGGLWGQGHGAGTQTQNGFVPYAATDFIFPAIAEERGFVGALALLAGYGVLFVTLALMAGRCPRAFDQLVIAGVLLLLGVQALVNLAMTLGLAPVTGITLPLVSYGGTSLLATLLALALALLSYAGRHRD